MASLVPWNGRGEGKRKIARGNGLEGSQRRAKETVLYGYNSKKHTSKNHFTSFRYFPDNTTLFVIWKKEIINDKNVARIKTVIIEAGRP